MHTAAEQERSALRLLAGDVFLLKFRDKVLEYRLDYLQDLLSNVSFAVQFVPGIGPWAQAVPDLVNAAISTARGNYAEAAMHVVFAVPYADILARFGGKYAKAGAEQSLSRWANESAST